MDRAKVKEAILKTAGYPESGVIAQLADAMADAQPIEPISMIDEIVQDELASLEIKRKHLDLLFKATHNG